MEYLMTYGWAILIIAVVLGALFQLGVFNASSFSPRAPPGACQVFRPSGPGTTMNINLMGVCTGQLPQYVAQFNQGYISTGSGTSLQSLGSAFTLAAWTKPYSWCAGCWERIVDKGIWGTSSFVLMDWLGTGRIAFGTKNQNDVTVQLISNTALMSNTFSMISATYDGSNLRIYLNGNLDAAPLPQTGTFSSGALFLIGGRPSGDFFNGQISNVQVYNSSLSANQIQALYLEGIGGAPMKLQNLIGWWPLNGNANDYSGNNNNGVPTAVTFTSQYGK